MYANAIIGGLFLPAFSFLTDTQKLGNSNTHYKNRSYYNQTFKSSADQENGWRSVFKVLSWVPGYIGISSSIITWVCPEQNETNEIDYYERLQFISGAKEEIKRLSSMKDSCKTLEIDNHTGQSFIEFLDAQIDKIKFEIDINERLDEIETKKKKSEYYYYGGAKAGAYKDNRSNSYNTNELVNYLEAYMQEGKRDY